MKIHGKALRGRRWTLPALWLAAGTALAPPGAVAQLATVGGGALVTERGTDAVGELHAETPPFADGRAGAFTGIGAGLLWLEVKDYEPDPMVVSSTVIPLPIPRTSFVVIASTTPFDDFDWSLVLKVGVTAVFVR